MLRFFSHSISHISLATHNPHQLAVFYQKLLSMQLLQHNNETALMLNRQAIKLNNLYHNQTPQPKHIQPGASQLCIKTNTPIAQIVQTANRNNFPIAMGPLMRPTILGPTQCVFLHDPDGNLVEITNRYLNLPDKAIEYLQNLKQRTTQRPSPLLAASALLSVYFGLSWHQQKSNKTSCKEIECKSVNIS